MHIYIHVSKTFIHIKLKQINLEGKGQKDLLDEDEYIKIKFSRKKILEEIMELKFRTHGYYLKNE